MRNRDFRGDSQKRRKLIPGGTLLTFARLSFQSFFGSWAEIGVEKWANMRRKKEKKRRKKWREINGGEDGGWIRVYFFREKEAQDRVAVLKPKENWNDSSFSTTRGKPPIFSPFFSSPHHVAPPNFVPFRLLFFSDSRWNYLHVPGFLLQRTASETGNVQTVLTGWVKKFRSIVYSWKNVRRLLDDYYYYYYDYGYYYDLEYISRSSKLIRIGFL